LSSSRLRSQAKKGSVKVSTSFGAIATGGWKVNDTGLSSPVNALKSIKSVPVMLLVTGYVTPNAGLKDSNNTCTQQSLKHSNARKEPWSLILSVIDSWPGECKKVRNRETILDVRLTILKIFVDYDNIRFSD